MRGVSVLRDFLTPLALQQAWGAHHLSRSRVSLSFLLAVWFFLTTSPPEMPRFFSTLWDQTIFPPPPPSWHLMHGFVFLSLSHGGLLHRGSCRAPCQRSLGKTAGWKKDQKLHLPNTVTKQMLSNSVSLYLHKDFGRYTGCCSLILPYSFNVTSKCLKSHDKSKQNL